MPQRPLLQLLTDGQNTRVTYCFFPKRKLAIAYLADEVTWEKDKGTVA